MAEDDSFSFVIEGGAPWGFRLQGGIEFRAPLRVAGLTPGGKAGRSGLQVGDYIRTVNDANCDGLRHNEVQKLVKAAGSILKMSVSRGSAPSLSPREPGTPVRKSISPVPVPPPVIQQQTAVAKPAAASQQTRSGMVVKETRGDVPLLPLPDGAIISQQKAFDVPGPVGRGPRRLTSGSDLTDTVQVNTDANGSSSMEMEIVSGPTKSRQIIKPVSTTSPAKPSNWYKDMFKSMHVTNDPRFSAEGSSAAFQTTEPIDVKTDQSLDTKRSTSSSQPPKSPVSTQQTAVPPVMKNATVSNPVRITPAKATSYPSTTTKTSEGVQPAAKVTVGGFQDPEAIIRQHKEQTGTEFDSKRLATPPQEHSPTVQGNDITSKEKSLSPPPPPPPPVAASEDVTASQTQPPVSVHEVQQSFSAPSDQFILASNSPTVVAIGFEGGIVGQPLSGQETAIPGGKQDDAFHTSNLIVQVGGNEAPQQIGSKDNVSEGQPWQNGQNAKLSSEVPKGPTEGTGTARALYPFKAETPRELEFKRGDMLTLLRDVDQSWLEGELNGKKGIFPKSYVEVITSIPKTAPGRPPQPASSPAGPTARAKFKFEGDTSVELSFKKGDIISLIRKVDQNWYEGKMGSKKGIFPVAYVEVLQDVGKKSSTSKESAALPNNGSKATTSQATRDRKSSSSGSGEKRQSVKKQGPSRPSQPPSRPSQPPSQTPTVLQQKYHGEKYQAIFRYSPQNKDELELEENDAVIVVDKCDDGWFVGTCERTGKFGTFPGNFVEKVG